MKQKKNVLKRLLAVGTTAAMIAGAMSFGVFADGEVKQYDKSDYVGYCVSYNGFNIYGLNNGTAIRTTFGGSQSTDPEVSGYVGSGYRTALKVGGSQNDTTNGFAFGTPFSVGDVSATITAGIDSSGKAVIVTYSVTNNGTSDQTVQIGTMADCQIGNNDSAPVRSTGNGLSMISGANKFYLIPGGGNFTTRYAGRLGGLSEFANGINEDFTGDSGFAWSWTLNVPAGGTVTRTAYLAAGEELSTYTLAFDGNGGTGTMDPCDYISGVSIDLPDNEFTRDGYEFKGWATSADSTTADYQPDGQITLTADTTLYAVWAKATCKLSFDANGGSGTMAAVDITSGTATPIPANTFTRDGYEFKGWATSSGSTTVAYADKASITITADTTLYAVWAEVKAPEAPVISAGDSHLQDDGDTPVKIDQTTGTITLGTTGQSKRLEQIVLDITNDSPYAGSLEYRVHVQDKGWLDWTEAGNPAGSTGQSRRIEAVEIRLTGELAEHYSVEYAAHVQDYGDAQGWVRDGAMAGTTGESRRLEQLRVRLVPRDASTTSTVNYRVHSQDIGWESEWSSGGAMSGTTGQSKRLEGIEIYIGGTQYAGGIRYRTHIQDIGWESGWTTNGELSGTQGKSKRLEAIQIELTGEMAEHYDVYYRTHVQDIGWMSWACNGESSGTAGRSARLEAIQIVLVPKGAGAPADNYKGVTSDDTRAFVQG